MNVGSCRWLWAGAVGLVVIAVSYPLATKLGVFNARTSEQGSEWQRKYWEAVSKADSASFIEDWREAVRLYAEITDLRPYDPVSRYYRATALAHVGRKAESLEQLGMSVEFGWSDVQGLRSDPVLEEVRRLPGFDKLLERARKTGDEPIVLYVPPGLDETAAAPLIITFHGLGENPHSHIRSWKQAADRIGAVVVAPRGNKRIGGGGQGHAFQWATAGGHGGHGDLLAFHDLLQESIEFAERRATIDDHRVILAGYSQGGSVALALLLDTPERFCGAVVQATGYSSRTIDRWSNPQSGDTVRVCVIVHQFDRMRPMGEEAYRALKSVGIDARLRTVTGADHELPLDNTARLIDAARFALGLESTAP